MQAGVDGLLHDKKQPSRIPPLAFATIERVVTLTQTDPPGETTHWTAVAMAPRVGLCSWSVSRRAQQAIQMLSEAGGQGDNSVSWISNAGAGKHRGTADKHISDAMQA